jgi:hypothetical protein
MRHNDVKTLRQVFREAITASRRRNRELEVILGLGRGNLQRLLDGTLEVRIRHLLEMAELLSVPPADFLAMGCPETAAMAKHRLTEWIAPGHRIVDGRTASAAVTAAAPAVVEAAAPERPMTRGEVAAVVREEFAGLVREELRNLLRATGVPAVAEGGEPQAV